MTDATVQSIILAIPSTIAAIAGGIAVVIGAINHGSIKELKQNTDGMSKALVRVTGQAEHAKGKIEGKIEGVAEAESMLPATVKRQETDRWP